MRSRIFIIGLSVGALLAATSLPASAQMVDDFMCSTFSYKCKLQKPLPPPQLAPGVEPIDAPAKKHVATRKHKVAKRTAAAPESAPTSPPSPADAAK